MAAAIENDEKSILLCTLCNEELKKPKLLSCQHSFCTQCLVQRHDENEEGKPFCCPRCQVVIELGDKSIEGLPSNYLYEVIKDSNACMSEMKCISCAQEYKQTNATHKCLDCGDTLCQNCNPWHCKFTTATKHHVVVPIDDIQEEKYKDEFSRRKILYCAQHSTKENQVPLSSYCETCERLVCVDCMHGSHYGHVFLNIQAERLKKQRTCEKTIKTLQASQEDQEIRIKTIKQALLKRKQIWDQQETDIYKTASELHALIDQIKDEKINELNTLFEKEIRHLNDLLEQEINTKSSLQATVAFTEMFVEKCSDSDLLYQYQDLGTRMEESKKRPSQNAKQNLVIFEKQETNYMKRGLGYVFGGIKTQTHFLHKGKIGQKKEKFRKIVTGEICGVSMGPKQGEIFLVRQGVPKIDILTENGNFKMSIQMENIPSDMHVRGSLVFAVNCQRHLRKVVVMDENGMVKKSVPLPGDDQNNCGKLSIAVGEDKSVFVASSHMHRVYKWRPEEDQMSIIISKEKGGRLASPQQICITPSGDLIVLNNKSSNVQIYFKDGGFQFQLPRPQESKNVPFFIGNLLQRVVGVWCDEDGYIYIVQNNVFNEKRIMVFHDQRMVGEISVNEDLNQHVPLISTPDGDLVYGNGKDLVRLSFWV